MAKPYLSVIIPAYNEAKRLPLTLVDVDKHLASQEFSYEILVVNDGSKDATSEIARRFSSLVENLKVIDLSENLGKGAAVRQGMMEARGNWRLFMDADNSTSVNEFLKMMPYFKESYDVVIGSRSVRGAKLHPPQPLYRRLIGKLGNLFVRIILLKGIWDTQCGFKCFSEESAEKIFPLVKINGWGFDIESLALARHFGYRIKEIPVFWSNSFFSHVVPRTYLQVLWETIKIWWWLKKRRYDNLV